jgi:SAM-dependent methyltransferase
LSKTGRNLLEMTTETSMSSETTLSSTCFEGLEACPTCGVSIARSRVWTQAYDILHGVTDTAFTYRECRDCHSVFLSPRPTAEAIAAFYPSVYEPHLVDASVLAQREQAFIPWLPAPLQVFLSFLKPILKPLNTLTETLQPDVWPATHAAFYRPKTPKAVLLDYGCGSGLFLEEAQALGWQVLGLDFSPLAVSQATAKGLDVRLIEHDTVWESIPDKSLDVVRLNHVFEHLYAPDDVLRRILEKLKPGGGLHIAIPNPESLSARLFKSSWRGLECPRHIVLYPQEILCGLLAQAGFAQVRAYPEFLTKDFARSLGFALFQQGRLTSEQAEAMAYDKLFNVLSYGVIRLLLRFPRYADRFHVLAYTSAKQ